MKSDIQGDTVPMTSGEQDHEWNFNPRRAVPDVDYYNQRAIQKSLEARRILEARYDIRYDEGNLATLDVFPAGNPDAPIHVFLHGGYWRGRDKSDYSYIAKPLVAQGVTTVVMNYDLCPAVILPEIVTQVRNGLGWVHANARDLGGSPDKFTVSGHSAGAHLAAMAAAADSDLPLPADAIKGMVLISGIYELTPVLGVTVNEQIRLTPDQVHSMSPIHHLPVTIIPLRIVAGGAEPPGWVRQSGEFADACRANGSPVDYQEIDGCHHFSIMTLAEEPDGILTRILTGTIGGTQA
jgi:arylformamidase